MIRRTAAGRSAPRLKNMHMRARIVLLFFLTSLAAPGCASKWSPAVETSAEPVQWRDDANVARATYVETIRGFKETRSTLSSILQSIVHGNRESDYSLRRPVAAAIGRDNRIAIADTGCACVHLYIPSEQKYRKLYGARNEELRTPVSVVFDDESRLFVSDSSRGAISVFDREGEPAGSIKKAGADPLLRPTGLSYAPGKKILYAVDTLANKVYAFDAAGELLFSFGGPGAQRGQFSFPTHIVTRTDGRVYVTDAMNFRVQAFDASGVFLSSFGHHGNGSGDFSLSKGIAVDRHGVIYVVDNLFDNIQLFNEAGGFLFTIGGRGTGSGEFWLPSGLFLDDRDKLYVCDTYNQRVQIIQVHPGDAQ